MSTASTASLVTPPPPPDGALINAVSGYLVAATTYPALDDAAGARTRGEATIESACAAIAAAIAALDDGEGATDGAIHDLADASRAFLAWSALEAPLADADAVTQYHLRLIRSHRQLASLLNRARAALNVGATR